MAPEQIIDAIKALDWDERIRLFSSLVPAHFCIHCGSEMLPCRCEASQAQTVRPGRFLFEFSSFDDWCDTAMHRFSNAQHKSTNTICLDSHGRTCWRGKDFMQARDESTFPVRVYSLVR